MNDVTHPLIAATENAIAFSKLFGNQGIYIPDEIDRIPLRRLEESAESWGSVPDPEGLPRRAEAHFNQAVKLTTGGSESVENLVFERGKERAYLGYTSVSWVQIWAIGERGRVRTGAGFAPHLRYVTAGGPQDFYAPSQVRYLRQNQPRSHYRFDPIEYACPAFFEAFMGCPSWAVGYVTLDLNRHIWSVDIAAWQTVFDIRSARAGRAPFGSRADSYVLVASTPKDLNEGAEK